MGQDAAVDQAEVNIGKRVKASTFYVPGSESMACLPLGIDGNQGEPARSQKEQSKSDTETKNFCFSARPWISSKISNRMVVFYRQCTDQNRTKIWI